MTEQTFNWSGKTSVLRDMFIMVVKVGTGADKYCLRREVGMASRSQNVLDDWEMISDTSSLVMCEQTMREECVEAVYEVMSYTSLLSYYNNSTLAYQSVLRLYPLELDQQLVVQSKSSL